MRNFLQLTLLTTPYNQIFRNASLELLEARDNNHCIFSVRPTLQHRLVPKMADEERRNAKRSRFDQTEPDVKRSSRFDRRSRSPSARKSELRRSRSPLSKEPLSLAPEDKKKAAIDPAAAAG